MYQTTLTCLRSSSIKGEVSAGSMAAYFTNKMANIDPVCTRAASVSIEFFCI